MTFYEIHVTNFGSTYPKLQRALGRLGVEAPQGLTCPNLKGHISFRLLTNLALFNTHFHPKSSTKIFDYVPKTFHIKT